MDFRIVLARLSHPATVADRLACVRRSAGSYQRAVLDGSARINGADLRGRAAKWSQKYKASRYAILAKLTRAGIPWQINKGLRGRLTLEIGTDLVS